MKASAQKIPAGTPEQPPFLGVSCSARGMRWVDRLDQTRANVAETIAQRHSLPGLLARVLAARGVGPDAVSDFLDPTLKRLMPDPSTLQDMDAGADRLAGAIRDREKIAIFGDYDVDGAASAALVARFLRSHGNEPEIYIPDRITEGYGPNKEAFNSLVEAGARVIVAVDCGTASAEPIAHARKLGADVIVIDHHLAGEHLPGASALINPNRLDDVSGQGDLAAAGVTFLFLVAVARSLRQAGWYDKGGGECDLLQWLDLVALATVCDVVPLKGLNRAFVAKGLQVLRQRRNTGLRALADSARLSAEPSSYHLGFVLGPRINAGGRIGDSGLGARLLTTNDDLEAAGIAATLERLNAERKALESAMCEEGFAQADHILADRPEAAVIVVHGEGWHRGIVGLVASRLTERFSRPSIAVAWDGAGAGAGSARSIPGVDIGSAISAACAKGLLIKGGGHAMAAGLTIGRDKLGAFSDYLEACAGDSLVHAGVASVLKIDAALMPSGANEDLMALLDQAGPYGSGNPQPRFAFAAHRRRFAKVVGESHIRCSLSASDGSHIDAIAFRSANTPLGAALLESGGLPLHVAGHLRRNHWGGRESIELQIEDAADPQKG